MDDNKVDYPAFLRDYWTSALKEELERMVAACGGKHLLLEGAALPAYSTPDEEKAYINRLVECVLLNTSNQPPPCRAVILTTIEETHFKVFEARLQLLRRNATQLRAVHLHSFEQIVHQFIKGYPPAAYKYGYSESQKGAYHLLIKLQQHKETVNVDSHACRDIYVVLKHGLNLLNKLASSKHVQTVCSATAYGLFEQQCIDNPIYGTFDTNKLIPMDVDVMSIMNLPAYHKLLKAYADISSRGSATGSVELSRVEYMELLDALLHQLLPALNFKWESLCFSPVPKECACKHEHISRWYTMGALCKLYIETLLPLAYPVLQEDADLRNLSNDAMKKLCEDLRGTEPSHALVILYYEATSFVKVNTAFAIKAGTGRG